MIGGDIIWSSIGKREVAMKQREICTVKDSKGIKNFRGVSALSCVIRGEGVEELNLWTLLMRKSNAAAATPPKVKHRITIQSSSFTPRHVPRIIESRDSNRYLYTSIHHPFTHTKCGIYIYRCSWTCEGVLSCTSIISQKYLELNIIQC